MPTTQPAQGWPPASPKPRPDLDSLSVHDPRRIRWAWALARPIEDAEHAA